MLNNHPSLTRKKEKGVKETEHSKSISEGAYMGIK